jgi:hypothetical protein
MWSYTLPMLPMSMNQRERISHWTRKRELAQIKTATVVLAQAAGIPAASGRRRVTVTIHKSLRSRVTDDPANRDSRAKSVLDAMVHAALLIDDSDKWLEWGGVVEGERRAQVETVVTLSDVTEAEAA